MINGFKNDKTYNDFLNEVKGALFTLDYDIYYLAVYKKKNGYEIDVNEMQYHFGKNGLIRVDLDPLASYLDKIDAWVLVQLTTHADDFYHHIIKEEL